MTIVVLGVLREILIEVAKNRDLITYTELSVEYDKRMGEWVDPHHDWKKPLLYITEECYRKGEPPLSALVVLADLNSRVPGHGFWGQLGTPKKKDLQGIGEWGALVGKVHNHFQPAQVTL